MPLFVLLVLPESFSLLFFTLGTSQTRQNLRFSSPAPVQTTSPAGPSALQSTRESCASRISTTRSIDGYVCTISEFVGYPCVVRNSFLCGDHWIEVICEGVWSEWRRAPVVVFQMWTVASDVPPPDASSDGCHGHQATA